MKHLFSVIAIVALLFATSCTKNEIKSTTTSTRSLLVLSTAINTADAPTSVSSGTCTFTIDNVQKQMDVLMNMPLGDNTSLSKFYLKGITTSYPATNVMEFTANQLTPTDASGKAITGYTIINMKGLIDENQNIAHITFQVRTASAPYQVVLTTKKILSALPDNAYDYSSATTAYCEFQLKTPKADSITTNLYMHNIKFADKMPTQTKIGIPGITVTPQANGFKLTADSITPNSYDSQGNATPMTSRKVNDFKGELDLVNGTYSVEFKCFGIDYKSSQDLNKLMTTLRVKK